MGTEIIYELDEQDRLAFVNDAWECFARANQAAYLAEPQILQRSLWDFIVDRETRMIYEILFGTVRELAAPLHFTYRCDTPTARNFMQLELQPREHEHIHVVSRVLRTEERPYTPLLDPSTQRSEEFVTICGWCKRVELPNGEWVEVEEAVEALHLFDSPVMPQLTHGICPTCRELFSRWRKPAATAQ